MKCNESICTRIFLSLQELDGTDNDVDMYSVRPILEITDRPFAMDVTALERLREIHRYCV